MLQRLPDLKEARAIKVDALKEILDRCASENRNPTDVEQKSFNDIDAEIKKIDLNIRNAECVANHERRMEGEPVGNGDKKFDTECREFSLRKAIASQIPGMNIDAGREVEISQELQRRHGRASEGVLCPTNVFEKRVITSTVYPGGAAIVPIDYMAGEYVDVLRAQMAITRLGARVLSGLQGNLAIPALTQSATAYWVAENAAITTSDQTFAGITMVPQHVGCLTEVSRNMIMQSSPDVEGLLRDDFAKVLASAMDTAAINGAGAASNQPMGILGYSGVGDVPGGAAGLAPTYENLVKLTSTVAAANAPQSGLGFLTNSKVIAKCATVLKSSADTSSNFICSPGATTLLDFPLVVSNNVPSTLTKGGSGAVCSAIIFGAWSELIVGYWSAFDLLVNPYESTAYTKGNVQIRGMLTANIVLRHPESFAKTADVLTT